MCLGVVVVRISFMCSHLSTGCMCMPYTANELVQEKHSGNHTFVSCNPDHTCAWEWLKFSNFRRLFDTSSACAPCSCKTLVLCVLCLHGWQGSCCGRMVIQVGQYSFCKRCFRLFQQPNLDCPGIHNTNGGDSCKSIHSQTPISWKQPQHFRLCF